MKMTPDSTNATNSLADSDADCATYKPALKELHDALQLHAAPTSVEAAVMRAYAKQHRSAPLWLPQMLRPTGTSGGVGAWLVPSVAIVASIGMIIWMAITTLSGSAGVVKHNAFDPLSSQAGSGMTAWRVPSNAPFIALQSLEQIALEPNPRVIETQIPKTMLTSWGVVIPPESAGESLAAEMLVSAAGQPLALRFSQVVSQ
jgi:hypothetical protein